MDTSLQDEMDTTITYNSTETIRTLKHDKDIVRTNVPSSRSETVADKSLDEVIGERKIVALASRWLDKGKDRNSDNNGDSSSSLSMDQRRNKRFQEAIVEIDTRDAMNMSLDAMINKKKVSTSPVNNNKDDSKIGKSLDEIIGSQQKQQKQQEEEEQENGEKNCGGGGRGQKRKREEEEDVYVMSPLEVVEKLTNIDGLIIEQEIAKQTEHGLGRSHNWRATITCGQLSVTVEATFKDLAKQAAAYEIIKILRGMDSVHFYPKCVIPEGCFYDNVVVTKLQETAQELGLESPRFETRQVLRHNKDFFITTYFIGEDEFQGLSHFEEHSRLFAAKAAFETYAQRKWPKEQYHVTQEKSTATGLRFHESETVHAMSIAVSANLPRIEQGVPLLALPEPESTDEEELLIDDCGRLYARSSDGTNKIRRLMKLQDLCPDQVVLPTKKLVEATGGLIGSGGGVAKGGDLITLYDQVQIPSMDQDELDYEEELLA